MTFGMSLVICAGICLVGATLNSVENFFLLRTLKRDRDRVSALPASIGGADITRSVRTLQRIRRTATYALMRPSMRTTAVLNLAALLEEECERRIVVVLRDDTFTPENKKNVLFQ